MSVSLFKYTIYKFILIEKVEKEKLDFSFSLQSQKNMQVQEDKNWFFFSGVEEQQKILEG